MHVFRAQQLAIRVRGPKPQASSSQQLGGFARDPSMTLIARRHRLASDIHEAAQRSSRRRGTSRPAKQLPPSVVSPSSIEELVSGLEQLEMLLPGFQLNIEALPAHEWVIVLTDVPALAANLIALKVLLGNPVTIARDASKVRALLMSCQNADLLVQEVPELLVPKTCASILVTLRKWWHGKKDPVLVLEQDPDIVRRAQENDMPWDPVFENEDGSWNAPELAYAERRADWQKYIDNSQSQP